MKILSQFVDRENEITLVHDIIDKNENYIAINFYGPVGIGKSWLARNLNGNCELVEYNSLIIDFRLEEDCDYLRFITAIRDKVNSPKFDDVNDVIEQFVKRFQTIYIENSNTKQVHVTFGEGNTFSGSFCDMAIGGDIINTNISVPKYVIRNLAQQMEEQVTNKFIKSLKSINGDDQIVVILDTYERASTSFIEWLVEKLIPRVAELDISCLHIVVCGQQRIIPPSYFKELFFFSEMLPFGKEDTIQYLHEKRKLTQFDGETVFGITRGHPQNLGFVADALEKYAIFQDKQN